MHFTLSCTSLLHSNSQTVSFYSTTNLVLCFYSISSPLPTPPSNTFYIPFNFTQHHTIYRVSRLYISIVFHSRIHKMSSRRSRSRHSGSSRITDDQINELVSKLQQLLPELHNRCSDKVLN